MVKGKILIVDDEAHNLDVLGTILDKEGYEVYCFSMPQEALHYGIEHAHTLDLILLDVMMPIMDGFAFCESLKKESSTKSIPVIFISALHDEESILRGIELGAVDFLTKPFSTAILKMKIRNAIKLYQLTHKLEILIVEEKNKNRLSEAILVQQSKLAAMGQMMENIAHQWRQPLNALGLMIQALPDDLEDGRIDTQYIDTIVRKTKEKINFMSKTIDDFRNFFRSGKEKSSFKLVSVLFRIFSIMEAQLKKHSVQLSIEFGSNLDKKVVYLDNKTVSFEEQLTNSEIASIEMFNYENELQQVLLNLLSNSLYALSTKEKKDKHIHILIHNDDDILVIELLDNAGGIPEEILPRIFEPYFTTKGHDGTGIGLYMSKVIIENNMGGFIAASNSKEGAIFSISFVKETNKVRSHS
jgi:two-component system, sensor histidine kinase and response regulator